MNAETTISVADAYRAMYAFLNSYWERGNRASEDNPIASLLGDIQFGKAGPTETADPAQWQDWLKAVEKVTE